MDVFRARWLVPVDGDPVEDGALAVEAGRIADVGPWRERAGVTAHDFGDCILLPGFVNAHTHLELTCYRGRLAPAPLWQWFDELIALRRRLGAAEEERAAVRLGAAESLAAGVTCLADISRTGMQIETLRASPLRTVCFLELISGASQPPSDLASLAAMLGEAGRVAEPDRTIIGISPHTLYTVTWDDLVGAGRLAAEHAVPVTLHLLETPQEARWLASGEGPLQEDLARRALPTARGTMRGRAVEWLRRAGFHDCRPLLAHVNYVDDDDLRDLAGFGAHVVWCPRSHAYFGHAPHRWPDMLAAGINVCLGTDSLASNQTLSILDEMRHVRRTAPDAPAECILAMGTIRGAAGLGLDPIIGSLRRGKRADFVTVPWDPTGPADPVANLLGRDRGVEGVWIEGKREH